MAFVKIPESTIQVKLVELTDNCIDKIADAVVRKLADRKTEPTISKMEQVDWKDQMWTEAVEDEPQTDCAWK